MSVKDENPSIKLGGTWASWGSGKVPISTDSSDTNLSTSEKIIGTKQINNDDIILVGSQVIYDYIEFTTAETKKVVGAYDETLLYDIFNNLTPPEGYKRAYRLSAQLTTEDDNEVIVSINGVALMRNVSWSSDYFRKLMSSRFFYTWNEFPKQFVLGYERNGLNLEVTNTKNSPAKIYNITVQGYFVKENIPDEADIYPYITCYMWKRIS